MNLLGRRSATQLLLHVPILTLFLTSTAYPHGGGLDAKGCHNDRKRGGYHCHRAQSSEKSSTVGSTKSGSVDQEEKIDSSKTPPSPQTFVGPRGGRYHYSGSGKKVYERRR